jgi:2-desacetyl-2-hydroxyethyl bacteriochlorophyllide A dehydrogenase
MKAIVLREIGSVQLEEVSEPRIEDSDDAIVRVTTAGICGSDLHIVQGRDPGVRMGTIMGHEFTGVVEATGANVTGFRAGDRVVAPFTANCGNCFYCIRHMPARCVRSVGFGFITEAGHGLHGAQAEFVRAPMASSTLMKVPETLRDEEALFLGDIFSTAYSCAENAALQKGDVAVVIGCGPVGLLCVMAAGLFAPSAVVAVDTVDYRLEKARELGAIPAKPDAEEISRVVAELTDGRGADAVLEAVGNPSALDLALQLIRPGAVVSIAGYHTETSYTFPIQYAYTKNLTLKIGRCHARKYMTQLLPLVEQKRLPLTSIITHTLPLKDGVHGYDLFSRRLDNAIKILLKP